MDFFQEPTLTAFLALILSIVVAKIVSFAVSNSTDEDSVVTLDKELRVVTPKGKKRVKFVDDVVVKSVDLYPGFEKLVAAEEIVDEKFGEIRVHQLGHSEIRAASVEQCSDAREEKEEMVIESGANDFDGNDNALLVSDLKSVNVDKEEMEFELAIDEKGEDGENEEICESIGDDYEDWEGIERSDLEKLFAEAVNYLEYGGEGKGKDEDDDRLAKLGSDVHLQLYGLHKVAVEGPCHESQPMALKVSARARWNAWQRLGSMGREEAMERYIKVLTDSIPSWMCRYSAGDSNPEAEAIVTGPILERESGDTAEFVQKDDMI